MGALRNLTRRIFSDGGNTPQAGGMFSPLAYGAMKPIVQEAYNIKDYVKEAKDSEENQLKAFNEMKVAQALSIDQENSKKLHDSYSGAFDQASKELSNPFTLSRFAQKQAIDYVNNPLRKNIEDSSKNLEISKEVAAKTPDVDPNATNGAINKALWMHEKNGGTNIDKNSVLGVVSPIRNQDLKESIQSAETLAHNLLKTSYSGLGKPTQDYLAGMGITQDTWNASNFDKTQAIADLVLKNNTGFKNSIFSREFQNQFENYKLANPQATDKEAREQAGKTYEQIAKEKIAETTRNLEKTIRIKDSGSDVKAFALPQGSGQQSPNIPMTPPTSPLLKEGVDIAETNKVIGKTIADSFSKNLNLKDVSEKSGASEYYTSLLNDLSEGKNIAKYFKKEDLHKAITFSSLAKDVGSSVIEGLTFGVVDLDSQHGKRQQEGAAKGIDLLKKTMSSLSGKPFPKSDEGIESYVKQYISGAVEALNPITQKVELSHLTTEGQKFLEKSVAEGTNFTYKPTDKSARKLIQDPSNVVFSPNVTFETNEDGSLTAVHTFRDKTDAEGSIMYMKANTDFQPDNNTQKASMILKEAVTKGINKLSQEEKTIFVSDGQQNIPYAELINYNGRYLYKTIKNTIETPEQLINNLYSANLYNKHILGASGADIKNK